MDYRKAYGCQKSYQRFEHHVIGRAIVTKRGPSAQTRVA
ncbi:hypothetical protein DICVIV_14462 [Dictyocaulus viviparus]|uniref:Uncharacterized protein n=1 Tax=Dictyocaulus viviparus TaxID=29172 RepID=A0A0D8XAX1_DICVI|nr:hypothetical protein DICVIV_14462 [Dictyocaulus viviparus]